MSMDGVVPPQSGPSRRPAGGPVNHSGAETPQGPTARRYGAQGHKAQDSGFAEHGSESRGFEKHGSESVVGGAESSESVGAPAWHGPIGSGEPDESGADGAGDGSAVEFEATGPQSGTTPMSAAEVSFAAALRASVAGVGVAGPPAGGLVRIRRKARTRQRNRVVVAGSAGVLMLAVAVSMATGARFDIVPTLTGASGASGGGAAGNQPGVGATARPSAAANGGHAVWPTGSPGKVGLAIGPVAPVVATPSSVAAAQMPLCTAASLKTSTTMGPTVNGVDYGHVDTVAQSSCVTVGPPVLTVANEAGTASSSIVILKENTTAAPQLPSVPTWGRTMELKSGQGYEFQFAWAATACPQSSASPSAASAIGPNAKTSMYYLGYAVTGTTPTAVVMLNAPCGAQVYVTDIYNTGAFPLPKASASPPPPVVSTPAAPPSTTPPPPPPPPSSPPASSPPPDSPSPSPSDSSTDTSGGGDSGVSSQATSPTS